MRATLINWTIGILAYVIIFSAIGITLRVVAVVAAMYALVALFQVAIDIAAERNRRHAKRRARG